MCKRGHKRLTTYIDFHSFDGKSFDDRILSWHISVKLMPALVPFDGIKFVSTKIETASQICCLSILNIFWDPNG
jgi:hypothetical protein